MYDFNTRIIENILEFAIRLTTNKLRKSRGQWDASLELKLEDLIEKMPLTTQQKSRYRKEWLYFRRDQNFREFVVDYNDKILAPQQVPLKFTYASHNEIDLIWLDRMA